jgi:hypothetical protein
MIVVDRESEEEAQERYYEAHPEDRQASGVIFMPIVDPKSCAKCRANGR